MFQDTQNDTSGERPALGQMIAKIKAGDSVRAPSFKHLVKTLTDLQNRIRQITASGAIISFQAEGLNSKATQTDPVSALQFQMLKAFATFEHASQKRQQHARHKSIR
jgi:DNA invertase Pin-like site-specific DNA recombinase